ncbi:MAG: GNAT family protein [Bacteroidales bacterium]|jgi:diamine N-acetyltransferase|nr:GNAT family N-acetyltransferase [Bacteroidales bacterium]NCU34926.1 N-acetyltransferase [Candidatus Falkowbacteria bacterium]MDD2632382.1 GNAT family protein [Bacteroidales bacterium]MDD3132226.1 GNAT family protein [Bacteroidales bacterium]MDD4176086.1 GNAT family protein [Bacteroidales bacterium]
MTLTGQNIYLRAPEPEDIEKLYQWENDPAVWHLSNTLAPYSRFDIEQYVLTAARDLLSVRQLRLMIVLRENNQAIGAIDLFEYDPLHRRAGTGILLDSTEQNKGYGTEALRLLIDYCFEILNLHQIYASITTDNTTSIKMFEKQGFVKTGTKRHWLLQNDEWKDEQFYQLIRP